MKLGKGFIHTAMVEPFVPKYFANRVIRVYQDAEIVCRFTSSFVSGSRLLAFGSNHNAVYFLTVFCNEFLFMCFEREEMDERAKTSAQLRISSFLNFCRP